jgi:hypothetical protein
VGVGAEVVAAVFDEVTVPGAAIVSTGVSPTRALQAVNASPARSKRNADLMGRRAGYLLSRSISMADRVP